MINPQEMEPTPEMCPKKRGRYVNPHRGRIQGHALHVLLWKLGWFDDPRELSGAPLDFTYPALKTTFSKDRPWVRWINHDTFLICYQGIHILTDPIWSDRCSPFSFIGPKRQHLPPIEMTDLPRIDFVLISHDHYDHLDHATVLSLHRLFPSIQWIVPHGVKKWLHRRKITKVIELSWWEQMRLQAPFPLKVTAVPAQHFSGRTIFDLNKTLWMGAVFEFDKAKTLYFAGDTGYNDVHFKEIGAKWRGFDVSLLPIGSYIPRKFMSPVHIDPAGAVAIHQDVYSRLSIAMHWKTFSLGDETLHQPPYDLFLAVQQAKVDPHAFRVLEIGHALNW